MYPRICPIDSKPILIGIMATEIINKNKNRLKNFNGL